jgi:hypothetical protein
MQVLHSLLQVNDMNAVPFGEDIRPHAGVPSIRAVAKMHTTLKQGFHRNI